MSPIRFEAAAPAPNAILLSSIRVDGGTQSRAGITNSVVADYAEAMRDGAVFPKITVFYDGSEYWLADGFHRFHALMVNGVKEADVDVLQGSRRDAILYSVGANSSHGLRRTNDDKRRAVSTLLADPEWSTWSDREIARRAGVSNQFVGNLRASSVNDGQMGVVRTVERSGTVYQQNTAAIGSGTKDREEGTHLPLMPEQDEDEITEDDLANDPGFQRVNEQLKNAKALLNEALAMPAPEPMTLEREAMYRHAFGTPEQQRNLISIINATKLLSDLPEPSAMVQAVPPTMAHAVDVPEILRLSNWFAQFARAWERSKGESA